MSSEPRAVENPFQVGEDGSPPVTDTWPHIAPAGANSAPVPASAPGFGASPPEAQEPPGIGRPAFPPPVSFANPHAKAGQIRGLPEIPLAAPDTVLDGADFDGVSVRGASLRGEDHRYVGESRQDSMGLWTLRRLDGPPVLLACVADGVGSQPYSHRGSARACRLLREEVAAALGELLDQERSPDPRVVGGRILRRVAMRMRAKAERAGWDPKALSTTLVAAVVELTPATQASRVLAFGLGDSAAYLLRDGRFTPLWGDEATGTPIADSATYALPIHDSPVNGTGCSLANDQVLVICTDGLVNPMRNREVEEFLAQAWTTGPVPDLLEFAWQLGFRAKSYGDDRTAVCIWGR